MGLYFSWVSFPVVCALIYVRLLYSSLVDLTDDEQAHREIRSGNQFNSSMHFLDRFTPWSVYILCLSGVRRDQARCTCRCEGVSHLDKKKSGARKQFSFQMLSQIPAMFEHHQIELGSICLFIYFLAPFRALSRLEAKLAIHNTHTHNCSNTNGYTILVYVICTTAGGKFVSK